MTSTQRTARQTAPLSDAIIVAVARLVDDAQSKTREPSHSDVEFQIKRCGLEAGDPNTQGQRVGEAKVAVELMGSIAELLLLELERQR